MSYKPTLVRVPPLRLTEDILVNLGFIKYKQNGRKVWRIKAPYYPHIIQVELGNYPATNPNCGTISVWNPKQEVPTFTKKGKKKMITLKESTTCIAWYVNTPERLHKVIASLTQENV